MTVLGGSLKSRTRGALAQELGVDGDAEVVAGAQARGRLEARDEHALARAGQHRRAEDDGVAAAERRDRGADLVGDALEVHASRASRCRSTGVPTQISARSLAATASAASAVARRRPDGHGLGDELADALLDDRGAALGDHRDLVVARVDADRPRARARRGRRPRRSRHSRVRRQRSSCSIPTRCSRGRAGAPARHRPRCPRRRARRSTPRRRRRRTSGGRLSSSAGSMAASISWPSMLSGIGSPSRYWIVGAMSSIDGEQPAGRGRRARQRDDALVAVAADVGGVRAGDLDAIPDRLGAALEVALAEPLVVDELDDEVGHALELRAGEELLAPVHRGHDRAARWRDRAARAGPSRSRRAPPRTRRPGATMPLRSRPCTLITMLPNVP